MSFRACVKKISPAILLLAVCCIEPYEPLVEQKVLQLLVVEGFMNASDGTASVKLSHTLAISDFNAPAPETSASVSIQSESGAVYQLTEQDSGMYFSKEILMDRNSYYTLHIQTRAGVEYASDTIRVKETPPIDSLGCEITNNGLALNILVNTHDAKGKARYYSWDVTETYEYKAPARSELKFVNKVVVPRELDESIFTCWRTKHSSGISIATSARLTDDIIRHHAITQVPKGSPELSVRYSVLVKQRAINSSEYAFLDEIRKTTENLGSIFGTIPFRVLGNIHRVDNVDEPVLGYFSGAEVDEKRFFIRYKDLPKYFQTPRTNKDCIYEQSCSDPPQPQVGGPANCIPIEVLSTSSSIILTYGADSGTYLFTSEECGDCRTQGGTTTRPDFW